jgi:AraC-like DNA-binding protein
MIVSGSSVTGVDFDRLGLPAGTALRYEPPAAPLRAFFHSYAVLDSDPALWKGPNSWALPGWPLLWITLAEAPITARLRNRHYAPLGVAGVYGSTSQAIPITSSGGVSIVIDISPLGWARWFGVAADAHSDRITPLDRLWPTAWVEELVERVAMSDRGAGVKHALDEFLLARLPAANAQEALISRAMAALADPGLVESADVAAALGISPLALRRLANRFFGHPPKWLMRRERFLHVLAAMLIDDAAPDHSATPRGYHDVSHFLRDAQQFLGMTPRRFLAMPMPYLRAVLRARRAVIGAPLALLDPRT